MNHGRLNINGKHIIMYLEPAAAMMAKRLWPKLKATPGSIFSLPANEENAQFVEWFSKGYPLDIEGGSEKKLAQLASNHRQRMEQIQKLLVPGYKPQKFELAIEPREYQCTAADWILNVRRGLLGDDVGLGKTCSAITAIASGEPGTTPTAVVTLTNITEQWKREINRFAPHVHCHIIRSKTLYDLSDAAIKGKLPDVFILNYHKLGAWAARLAEVCNLVVFDEVQELRRSDAPPDPKTGEMRFTEKYAGALTLSEGCEMALGMSATPIYNFGGEIYNIMDAIHPGRLGEWREFADEWCESSDRTSKARLKDAAAFGDKMRRDGLMLRRTAKEVGRELPEVQIIQHEVESDQRAINAIRGKAGELARIILGGKAARGEAMSAAGQMDTLLRQATGVAKAPYVAEFARMLLENGEPIVLFGYHHAVYEIWGEALKEYRPAFYTGKESVQQKEAAKNRFCSGDTDLIIVSLRSGIGLDGLQYRSRISLFGEMDWAPAIHKQCIGRTARDGQKHACMAYFLVSNSGTDPIMIETLGLKNAQSVGLLDGNLSELQQRVDSGELIKRVARQYLQGVVA